MQLANTFLNKFNFVKFLYISLFCIFVTSHSIALDGQGVSANYLFLFFPLIALIIKREIAWPPISVLLFMVMLSLIFLIGAITQVEFSNLILRRSLSFIAFMTVFTFMFVKLDSDMIRCFKLAIVFFSLFECTSTIAEFISIDGNNIGTYGKGIVGSQRVAFIYIIGFWLAIMFKPSNYAFQIVKFIVAFILLSGLFLTFSRSTMVGLAGSMVVYSIYLLITSFKDSQSTISAVLKILSKTLYLIMLFTLVLIFFTATVTHYKKTIYNYIFKPNISSEFVEDLNVDSSLKIFKEDINMQFSESISKDTVKSEKISNKQNELAIAIATEELNKANLIKAEAQAQELSTKIEALAIATEELNKANLIKAEAQAQELSAKIEALAIATEELNKANLINAEAQAQVLSAKIEALAIAAEESNKADLIKAEAQAQELFNISQKLAIAIATEESNKADLIKAEAQAQELSTKIEALDIAIKIEAEESKKAEIIKVEAAKDLVIINFLRNQLNYDDKLSKMEFNDNIINKVLNNKSRYFETQSDAKNIVVKKSLMERQNDFNKAGEFHKKAIIIESQMQRQIAESWQVYRDAKISNDPIAMASKAAIYQTNINKGKVTYNIMVVYYQKLLLAKDKMHYAVNEVFISELRKILDETQKQLKLTKDKKTIDELDKVIDESNKQLLAAYKTGGFLDNKINKPKLDEVVFSSSSLGYRVYMHRLVFQKTLERPLIGSAFLGVWSMFDSREGSAHSQYLDILYRVGVVAFIIYIFFITKVTHFLYRKDLGLFFGFIGFLFIGLLHETIKLSQGGFVFAFLFAMWAQRKHLLNSYERSS